jgi:hypothetical protein
VVARRDRRRVPRTEEARGSRRLLQGDCLPPAKASIQLSALGGGVPVAIRLISDAMIEDDNNRSKTWRQAERLRSGAGPESIRKARGLLGGIMQRAVEHGRIPVNAARQVARHVRPHDRRA